MVNQKKEEY